ncbi:MAG: hypothetical protein FJ387_29695 [Verrucomicrobia bacterium]|nr:hypothetical protein [Verrucomicrobiota bacterium]
MATSSPDLVALIQQLPDADTPGQASKFTGPAPADAERLCRALLEGGAESVRGLIRSLREPGHPEFRDFRAEYLLHCAVLQVGQPGRQAQRALLAETLVAEAANAGLSKPVRRLLLRELHMVGDERVVPALGALLADEDLCQDAASTLVAIRTGAAEELTAALGRARGKCRLVLIESLGAVPSTESAGALSGALGDGDPDIRMAAAWALARLGDASAAEPMLRVAGGASGYERIKVTQACLLLAEHSVAAGRKPVAARIYQHLHDTRTDATEGYVRELAAQALATLK